MALGRYLPIGTAATLTLSATLVAVAATVPLWRRGELARALTRAARVLLAGATVAVLQLTLAHGDVSGSRRVNLVPGASIRLELDNVNRGLGLANLAGNVALFAPIGFLAVVALRWSWERATGACLVVSVVIETCQLTLGRSADVDDVLLNLLGGALGAAVAVAARHGYRALASIWASPSA